MSMESLQKEIQNLKTKILYLCVSFIVVIITVLCLEIGQMKDYMAIRQYYQESQKVDQEINRQLQEVQENTEDWIEYLQEILSESN